MPGGLPVLLAFLGPRDIKSPHPPYVARRKTIHFRERFAQILRQPFHHLLAITPGLLCLGNDFPDVPIKQDQFAVDRNHRSQLCRADAGLEVGEERAVTGGKRAGRCAILSTDFCQPGGLRFSFRHTKCLPAVLPAIIRQRFRKLRAGCLVLSDLKSFSRASLSGRRMRLRLCPGPIGR